ncbi:MAG: hypothetical protein AB7V14_12935 [Kiritimatiellia bacterium]
MNDELEANYGHALQLLVTHLIKNAYRDIPPPVVQGALDFESRAWGRQDAAAKRARLRDISASTEAPSDIHRHFEAYPHPFSKKSFARFLATQALYKEALGA